MHDLLLRISLLLALGAMLLYWERTGKRTLTGNRTQKALTAAEVVEETRALADLPQESLARRLREARWPLTPLQFQLARLGLGAIVCLLSNAIFVPGLPSLLLGGLAWFAPQAALNEFAATRAQRLEALLPQALTQIATGFQSGQALEGVLERVAVALMDQAGPNPLSGEFLAVTQQMRSQGRQTALKDLAQRTTSVSLANLALLLDSYVQGGGGRYGQAVTNTAIAVQSLIGVRNKARAKSAQAMQTARAMPVLMFIALLVLLGDPILSETFRTGVAQVVISVVIGVMALGYLLMTRLIRGVV